MPRARPWAYEELLFGPRERTRSLEFDALTEAIRSERDELERLYEDVDAHVARIARLNERLHELTEPTAGGDRPPIQIRSFPARTPSSGQGDSGTSPAQRSYLLARCQGFEVESPDGPIGIVEGLRFGTRIDQPDVIEVRGGRLGRQLILVPVEHVEDVRVSDEIVVLRTTPAVTGDLLDGLVDHVRKALHVRPTPS